jgi:hypothetical protein
MDVNNNKIEIRRHPLPHVETYDVTADELDRIENESKNVGQDFQYCSICVTAAIAFFIAIITTEIKSARVYQTFLIITLIGFVFAIYFGQAYVRGKDKCRSTIDKIRERQIGPVGEEGRELKPADVAELSPVPAPPSVLRPPSPPPLQESDITPTGVKP